MGSSLAAATIFGCLGGLLGLVVIILIINGFVISKVENKQGKQKNNMKKWESDFNNANKYFGKAQNNF